MRDRSHTLRRGPKHPLPLPQPVTEAIDTSESTYYSIDNTEEIYGTKLSPSQRCYVDPWDLENYDYVRKKIDSSSTPQSPSGCGYYDTSLSPSPAGEPVPSKYYYLPQSPGEPQLLSLPPKRLNAHPCTLGCCSPQRMVERAMYTAKYDDYMMSGDEEDLNEGFDMNLDEPNPYVGYGGFSLSSSTEHTSSCCDESVSTMMRRAAGFASADDHNRDRVRSRKSPSKINFTAPAPRLPVPAYDHYNPYTGLDSLPYCTISDCYECLAQQPQNRAAMIYAAPSIYGSSSIYGGSTLSRRTSSSVYSATNGNKFGLSKKGLLQIDYSCSWNDLDRVIGRNY